MSLPIYLLSLYTLQKNPQEEVSPLEMVLKVREGILKYRLRAGIAVYSSRHPLYDLRTGKTVLGGDTCQMLKGARHPPHAPYARGAWLRQLPDKEINGK